MKALAKALKIASSLRELSPAKMAGAKNAYCIRFGNYRIGFYLEGDTIILSRALDREEMYRFFPKN